MENPSPTLSAASFDRSRGLFITATDTGVGKTVVSAALSLGLQRRGVPVRPWKPVQSGSPPGAPDSDAAILAASLDPPPDEPLCTWSFPAPLAPLLASRLAGQPLRAKEFRRAWRELRGHRKCFVVEGAGGLLAPLAEGYDGLDLAVDLGLPVIIVARPGLGTINHTLLTLRALRDRGLRPLGIVLNGYTQNPIPPLVTDFSEIPPERAEDSAYSNPWLLAGLGQVPVIGQLPWLPDLSAQERAEALAPRFDWSRLLPVCEPAAPRTPPPPETPKPE